MPRAPLAPSTIPRSHPISPSPPQIHHKVRFHLQHHITCTADTAFCVLAIHQAYPIEALANGYLLVIHPCMLHSYSSKNHAPNMGVSGIISPGTYLYTNPTPTPTLPGPAPPPPPPPPPQLSYPPARLLIVEISPSPYLSEHGLVQRLFPPICSCKKQKLRHPGFPRGPPPWY